MKKLVTVCVAALCLGASLAHAADKKFTIAGIVFQEDQFMKTTLLGMKSVAEKEGVNLLTSNTSNQISKEVEVVNTYAARGVDAIAITYLDAPLREDVREALLATGKFEMVRPLRFEL